MVQPLENSRGTGVWAVPLEDGLDGCENQVAVRIEVGQLSLFETQLWRSKQDRESLGLA